MTVLERFLRYIAVDTTSREDSEASPSTPAQRELGARIAEEMTALGVSGVRQDEFGYVYGFLPANREGQPAIGLIAHLDTSDAVAGGPIRPRIVRWEGQDVVLNEARGVVLRAAENPALAAHVGEELVVTDGTTLLGGDDKAGVAEIMTLCERLLSDPSIPHGKICVAFTPDEEIGRGADRFDVEGFGADFAYTVDGGELNEIEYENFNAASAVVRFQGFSIHPGSAKGRMKNAATIAMEFHRMLPPLEIPENTEGYEGFVHLTGMHGGTDSAVLEYIIRDHDREKFEHKKERLLKIAAYLNDLLGDGTVTAEIRDSYYNMKEMVLPHREILDRAEQAMKAVCGECRFNPIRGGTDGSRLSYMGLPCPNLPTGGFNCHGVLECVSVRSMEKAVDLLEGICRAR